MPVTKSTRRDFLQLADTFDLSKHKVAGFYISEKLDGTRCLWDGGLTRGMKTKEVPWANVTDPKTGQPKANVKPISTGLWSRYGNPIMAPDSFLNSLPCCPLDGELWAGRETFQLSRSICGGNTVDPRFDQISYAVYSSPPLSQLFKTGEIKDKNFTHQIDMQVIEKFVCQVIKHRACAKDFISTQGTATFEDELLFLRGALETQNDNVFLHRQVKLSHIESEAKAQVEEFLEKVLVQRGEGVVIRDPSKLWTPKRHRGLLKYKPFDDAEAVVIGYVAGEVGQTGQALGKIGALRVRTINFRENVEFKIGSGLTLEQREFSTLAARHYAAEHPGQIMPGTASGKHIPVGSTITFKYRELSDDGIPKEGRFWRVREGIE